MLPFGNRIALALLAMLAAAAAGCGGGQTRGHPLDRNWSDADGSELASFVQSWSPSEPAKAPDLAVGVIDERWLVGRELPSGTIWRFEHVLEGRPALAGELVVGIGGGELFALDGRTGDVVWTRPAIGALRGAGDDGTTTVVSLGSSSERRSIVLGVTRDGAVARQLDAAARVGVPAVRDGVAFLPWNDRFVSVFELGAGREQARVLSATELSRAWVADGELFLGHRSVLLFDSNVVDARSGGGTQLGLPTREFPGAPVWLRPGTTAPPLFAERRDTIQLLARPLVGHGRARRTALRWADDGYALVYRQVVLGLDASTAAVRWAHTADAPYLGGAASPTGFCLCDATGHVRWLAGDTGRAVRERWLTSPLRACTVQCEQPVRRRRDAEPAGPPVEASTRRARQLLEALSLPDGELRALQLELLGDLAGIEGDEATFSLVALARAQGAAVELRAEASQLLARRRSGAGAMLEALELAAGAPPWAPSDAPIAELSQALGAMAVAAAAPALGSLLSRGNTSPAEARAIARALEAVATEQQLGQLDAFVARHACGQDAMPWSEAVLGAARTLLRFGQTAVLRGVVGKPCENDGVRQIIGDLLATAVQAAPGSTDASARRQPPVF